MAPRTAIAGVARRACALLAPLVAFGCAAAEPRREASAHDDVAAIRSFEVLVLRPSLDPRCFLVRSATEWASARVALGPVAEPLGPDASRLPDVPCAFDADAAVLVVMPMGIHMAEVAAATTTEEGVDVLTITRTFRAEDPTQERGLAYLSQAALVVLPQRPRQLAVVLKTIRGARVEESTLAVFDGRR
jgi:hypothetical protein